MTARANVAIRRRADLSVPGHGRRVATLAWIGVAIAAMLCAGGMFTVYRFAAARQTPPGPEPPGTLRSVSDRREVVVSVTTPDWTKVREVVTVDAIRSDRTLWRRMHFGDWDTVPRPIREQALRAMIQANLQIFEGPRVWRRMSAADWDTLPQPIRAMAYLRMIWHWAAVERLGAEFGLEPAVLAQTVGAIVMTESWFEHRAVNVNPWGNRDLGLAQCSDYCRDELAVMARDGTIAFVPDEADYFNPWTATRIATVWFERELLRADGDVDLAIRAYHRGLDAAMDEKGDAYLARVQALRQRYIRTRGPSPTWRFLAQALAAR